MDNELGIPAIVECPSRACLKRFEVQSFELFLPRHDQPDGRPCPYQGPGRPIQMLG